jgi:hypothetical protein
VDDKLTFTVTMEVTQAQALALKAMFEYWNNLGSAGSSRIVGFYCDGDGNFQPKCTFKSSVELPELTDEMRKVAIIEEDDGDRTYDFDPIGWMLHKD